LSAKRRERSVAHVRSAFPLSEEQQQRLVRTLQRIYSRPIALHLEVDPEVGGGLFIRVGDEVIDGSIRGRLEALRRDLAEREGVGYELPSRTNRGQERDMAELTISSDEIRS